jgi:hypothetical protein
MLSTHLFTKNVAQPTAQPFKSANETASLIESPRGIIHRSETSKSGLVNKFPCSFFKRQCRYKKTVLSDGCLKKECGSGLFRLGFDFGLGAIVFSFQICISTFPFFNFIVLSAHK